MCKPCVNQILPCANQKQPCVNCFAPYANPQFSAIPTCFAKPSGHTSYFHVLITCRTFPVQSGEVTFWGQKKFTHFITVLPGLPPDVRRANPSRFGVSVKGVKGFEAFTCVGPATLRRRRSGRSSGSWTKMWRARL